MDNRDIARRLNKHDEQLRDHEANIAVLVQRATQAEKERNLIWDKKDALEEKYQTLREEMSKQHNELMAAITANKAATSIIKGEKGALKWVLTFLATAVLAVIGIAKTLAEAIQWLGPGAQ